MFIRVEQQPYKNVNANKAFIITTALRRLAKCQLSRSELLLNNYCVKNYKLSLKGLVKKLIDGCVVQFNQDSSFIILFSTPELDNIASLITYGNTEVQGSNILRLLFSSNQGI